MSFPPSFRFVRARVSASGNDTRICNVEVRDGVIASINAPATAALPEIDLAGLWLLPGAIDGHVHFDDPGFTHREDFASGTIAASAGGVTTIVDMPCTSLPPVVDGKAFRSKLAIVAPKARVDFAFWGGARGNAFDPEAIETSLRELAACGVRSIKTYLVSGMETFEALDADALEHVLRVAASLDVMVGVHAEDSAMIAQATAREGSGGNDTPDAYLRIRSVEAEAAGVATCVRLAEKTRARVHVVHLACGEGVQAIRQAQARGVTITAETCPHYLQFTSNDLSRLGSVLKTAPVVKSQADQDALWEGLADGTIAMIATDHAPGRWPEEKCTGSFSRDYGGVPGVELMMPFVLSHGVARGRLSLERALELMCAGPARVHHLEGKGALRVGNDADLVVFDPAERWTVRAAELWTRQKYSPFEGVEFQGRVRHTFVRGKHVFDIARGPVGEPSGRMAVAQPCYPRPS